MTTGCDDGTWAVTVTVAHTYEITARDEEEALKEALRRRGEGEAGKVTWPAGYDIQAIEPQLIYGNERHGNE